MNRKKPRFTEQQIQLIRDNYHTMKGSNLANMLGISKESLYKKASYMGLKKNIARNGEPYIQAIRGKRYLLLNENGKTLFLHRIKWEECYGDIPKGSHLRCKGDTANPEPDNWELVTKEQQAVLNQNNDKAAQTMKAKWAKVKRWEAMGMKIHFSKLTSKRTKTHTPVTIHDRNLAALGTL